MLKTTTDSKASSTLATTIAAGNGESPKTAPKTATNCRRAENGENRVRRQFLSVFGDYSHQCGRALSGEDMYGHQPIARPHESGIWYRRTWGSGVV